MEEWRTIEGYPDYMVSSLGRVKSLERKVQRIANGRVGERFIPERILRQARTGRHMDYFKVNLFFDSRQSKSMPVHRLVAKAFLPRTRPEADQVNHKNGDAGDNRVENLEWVTHSENLLHASEVLKRMPIGEQNYQTKITTAQAIEAKRLLATGMTCRQVSNLVGIGYQNTCSIKRGDTWRHISAA